METTVERSRFDGTPDPGFSLIEVIVAIAIISVVALASASLTINGISLASSTQRQQIAVTIANGALETASAQPASTIYSGRKPANVQAAFSANSAVAGVSVTYQLSDTSVPDEALPITPPAVTQSGTKYTTTVLVGSCYQQRTGGYCAKLPGNATTPPSTIPAGYIPLIRVIVVVRWTATKGCAPGGCYYSATTLVDPGKDLQWVIS